MDAGPHPLVRFGNDAGSVSDPRRQGYAGPRRDRNPARPRRLLHRRRCRVRRPIGQHQKFNESAEIFVKAEL